MIGYVASCPATYNLGLFSSFYGKADCLGLYGQVNKRIRWMPWRQQAMKDVVICDKLRGVDK